MTIETKLNESWNTSKTMNAVFEVRAQAETVYNVLQESIVRINEITSDTGFSAVDTEIKDEGRAIINILNQAKDALDKHSEFLKWRQSE